MENDEPNAQPGLSKGLQLTLDAHSDQLSSSTIFDAFKGFIATVHNRKSIPMTKEKGFLIRPGQITSVAILGEDVSSNNDTLLIDPIKRNCYFYHEYNLNLFKKYSYDNCLFECKIDFAREEMESNCTPWYYPGNYI